MSGDTLEQPQHETPDDDAENPKTGKRTKRDTAADRRANDERAASLRVAGYTYVEIAKALGYANQGGAWKAVQRIRSAAVREAGQELLGLELERLDTLQRANMTKALQGDAKATNTILRVMDQRARLAGLYDARTDALVADAREAFAVFLGAMRTEYPEPVQPDDVA